MTRQEFVEELLSCKKELEEEVISRFQKGEIERGEFAFDRWRDELTRFLQEHAPDEAARFEKEMQQLGYVIVPDEDAYTRFMREQGKACLAFLDELNDSALKGRVTSLEEKKFQSLDSVSILFLAADPSDAARLRLGEEAREIQEKLQLSKYRKRFRFDTRTSVRPADISQALLDLQPQIVHFSGHGTTSGELCFEDQQGESCPVKTEALARLFEQFKTDVHCVLLNACYSETQAKAIAKYIDYVIGVSKDIEDKAAIAFTIGFYQALGAGLDFEKAYEMGRVQILLQNIPENLTPILIAR